MGYGLEASTVCPYVDEFIGCCRGEDRDCRPAPSFGEITRETDPRIHVPLRIRPLVIADKLFISRHSIDIYIPYKPLRHASMRHCRRHHRPVEPRCQGRSNPARAGRIPEVKVSRRCTCWRDGGVCKGCRYNEVRQVDGVADSDAVGRRGLEDSTISRVRIACF
jgi:hypothetical protein